MALVSLSFGKTTVDLNWNRPGDPSGANTVTVILFSWQNETSSLFWWSTLITHLQMLVHKREKPS